MNETESLILLGDNIRRYREREGLTYQQLSDKVDVEVTNLILLEAGQYDIDTPYLFRIAKVLNVKMVDFVEGLV